MFTKSIIPKRPCVIHVNNDSCIIEVKLANLVEILQVAYLSGFQVAIRKK